MQSYTVLKNIVAQYGTAWHTEYAVQYGTVQLCTLQYCTAQYCTIDYRTALCCIPHRMLHLGRGGLDYTNIPFGYGPRDPSMKVLVTGGPPGQGGI